MEQSTNLYIISGKSTVQKKRTKVMKCYQEVRFASRNALTLLLHFSWSLLENPNEPVSLPYSSLSLLRFDLPEHFVGEIPLSVTPYAEDIATGEKKFVEEATTVTINVRTKSRIV